MRRLLLGTLSLLMVCTVGCGTDSPPRENESPDGAVQQLVESLAKNVAIPFVEEVVRQNPELLTAQGQSPLHNAVSFHQLDVAKELLRNGADVNARDNEGNSPLHYAALSFDSLEFVELLLQYKADPNLANAARETPLHYTLWGNMYGRTQEAVVERLLAAGADVLALDGEDTSPLCLACSNDTPSCVERLLAAGADVNQPEADGWAPLHYAVNRDLPS